MISVNFPSVKKTSPPDGRVVVRKEPSVEDSSLSSVPDGHVVVKEEPSVEDSSLRSAAEGEAFTANQAWWDLALAAQAARRDAATSSPPEDEGLAQDGLGVPMRAPSPRGVPATGGQREAPPDLPLSLLSVIKQRPYSCYVCQKTFASLTGVSFHTRAVHPDHRCAVCQKSGFASSQSLIDHQKNCALPNPGYPCDVCGKTFSQLAALDTHKSALHTEEKQYRCNVCQKSFSLKTVYTEVMHFKCDMCRKVFPVLSRLEKHQFKNHGGKKCDECDRVFPKTGFPGFKQHKLDVHTEWRPCDECQGQSSHWQ